MTTLIFGGDTAVGRNRYHINKDVRALFEAADASFLNLEAPILAVGSLVQSLPKAGPYLAQGEEVIALLHELQTGYVSGANNHLLDYGWEGVQETAAALEHAGVAYGGFGRDKSEASRPLVLKEANIAVVCAAEEEFGVAEAKRPGIYSLYDDALLEKVSRLRREYSFVIAYTHGGGEEIPLPSRYVRDRYRALIRAGAQLVVGHHPHIPQGMEQYEGGYVFYSLGNFIHQNYSHCWGAVLQVVIDGGRVSNFNLIPVELRDSVLQFPSNTSPHRAFLADASAALADENTFDALHQEQALDMYNRYYQSYFTGLFSPYRTYRIAVKRLLKKALGKRSPTFDQHDELLLLHLLRNRSHHEFITTALKLATGETTDLRTGRSRVLYYSMRRSIIDGLRGNLL